jgi:lipopolysaccharide biosynthesis glycosyltransferase
MSAAGEVDIALGVDRAYAPHAAAVIASVARHALGARFRFIILHAGVEPSLRARVEQAAPGARFNWSEVGDDDVPAMADREHFSRAILFRLGIEKHAPADCRRLIYLDADVIVAADVRDLWSVDLGDAPIGAVADCFVDAEAFAERWNLPAGAPSYFNSGVLLIDLQRVRAERLFSKAIDFSAAHIDEIYLADQDALNHVCWGRWARLEPKWNVQRHMAIPSLIAQTPVDRQLGRGAPAIIHYTGPEKPWLAEGYHPWSWLYWESLARTPFRDEVARQQCIGPMKRFMLWQRYLRRRAPNP